MKSAAADANDNTKRSPFNGRATSSDGKPPVRAMWAKEPGLRRRQQATKNKRSGISP